MINHKLMQGFNYIRSDEPKMRYKDRNVILTIKIEQLPYGDNPIAIRKLAEVIMGEEYPEVTNIAQNRITSIRQLKDNTWRVDITEPYKD